MIYRAEERSIRLVLAGDAMPARSLKPFDEPRLLQLAHAYEQSTDWHLQRPPL